MCCMCHYCGAELRKVSEEQRKQENGNPLRLNGEGPIWSCGLCREKKEREYMKQDKLSLYSTPMISPTTSLSSSDRSFSSCSDLSVDGNSYDRSEQGETTTNNNQEDLSFRLNAQMQNSHLEGPVNGLDRSNKIACDSLKHSSSGNDIDIMRDVEILSPSKAQEPKVNSLESISRSDNNGSEQEKDASIWEPPEAENPEDDAEGGVGYDDDDDNDDGFGDGTKWGKPSSLSDVREEGSGKYKSKEKKQRAMEAVMSGKFKAIVNQLLKSVGVASSEKDGESWVEIVTLLSWEAASSLKPDAIDKAMDPNHYIKVKCIATGYRSQSEVIKGLVFKKHAAHKHMPTKYTKPRLLLVRGVLGQSSSGLLSFHAMEQEKGQVKSVMEMIEICNPNVVLVEKTVSRDIQESILVKGMTLVLDMKLHRLERVARCTGAPIVSAETLTSQKLKHCDSFHIEKFIEEHAGFTESGKRPSKTLMFIEGCPTRLGCTVLLKGSNSDELKRIKYVVQCAFVLAYHLILETSFLVDQRAMFSTIPFAEVADVLPTDQQYPASENSKSSVPCLEDTTVEKGSSAIDIPISDGLHEDTTDADSGLEGQSVLSLEPYNPAIFSGFSSLSASLKKVIGDNFPLANAASYQSLSSLFGFNGKVPNGKVTELHPVSKVDDTHPYEMEAKSISDGEKLSEEHGQSPSMSGVQILTEEPGQSPSMPDKEKASVNTRKDYGNDENQGKSEEDASAALDSQSILVLVSSRNAFRDTICEQSHFSHIMFYKNFDIPLGKFLQDNLLNQRTQCATCGELPEAHFYYYAHHKKQLTIQVKRLPDRKRSPGEVEGKIWMWSRCGKCKSKIGVSKSTKRVLICTAACSLSFGKFLELSFSHHSSSDSASSCGHSVSRDFLYFFGLGPMVAMFSYSPVITYTVSVPPQKLEFSHSVTKEWLKEEVWNLYTKGMTLFTEVESSLKQIGSRLMGSKLNIRGSLKELSVVLEILKQECAAFKVDFQNAVAENGNPDETVHKLLSLNRLRWEILLESCIWDRRLHSLIWPDPTVVITTGATEKVVQEQSKSKMEGPTVGNEGSENDARNGDKFSNGCGDMKDKLDLSAEANEGVIKEIPIDGLVTEFKEHEDMYKKASIVSEDVRTPAVGCLRPNSLTSDDFTVRNNGAAQNHSGDNDFQAEKVPLPDNLKGYGTISNFAETANGHSPVDSNASENSISERLSNLEKVNGWVWMPFSELRQIYMRDLQKGYVPKFEHVSRYTLENLPALNHIITEEGSRLHVPLGTDNYMVSDYEGELSSIIACALSLLKDLPVSAALIGAENRKDSEMPVKTTERFYSLSRIPTIKCPQSINGTTDSDSVHPALSISSDDSRFSSFDGLNLLESLIPPEILSPEVSFGVAKTLGKSKFSVKCLYANQFRDLRSRCCPSEIDYIGSLSRCRNWDAKGGKSKSLFAKTLDDRFIIKEIKKTEFDSFDKFALHYFKYMNESFELGNQTCLAKVLGIYQVTVRQTKSGKETRHDVMVMENLTFGRNISRQYDLKGALHARYSSVVDGSGNVLLDQNFVNDMNSSPLYVSNKAKRILQRAVWNDTTFLNSIDVMDYSLLVGVDSERQELVCGIIDYLRQYTWDKHLETWVKSSLAPKNVLPTVISPIEYKKRFRKFMSTHFLSVPDHWCSEESQDPCKLCCTNDDISPQES
ncbi:putative 1-phosphatidylinositol-3-phosphate 5-kinase FAB1D isoform X2 [Mangifera indica]|uniref:putative 1-phosphatidylinositol-3-phosphate 5-kinase FAB1D isoform X2 n=1 Tax=Mangifera indica TaxID=29780 RepID=UPI001CFA387B|nr:putative 1-phosphatidylinositol-3-phosphate 5-kinase FAB1D isoform X2 [Mangifera indica]